MIKDNIPSFPFPFWKHKKLSDIKIKNDCPTAKPSKPSIQLIEFINAVIHKVVKLS